MDSIRVILQVRAMIITQKANHEFTGTLGNISKESRDLGYCWSDTLDSLICNSHLEGFKLYFGIYKS